MKHIHNDLDVATIRDDASLREAAEAMASRSIGCLVVLDASGAVIGIVTDRDLCLRAVAFDRDPDRSNVGDAMTPRPRTAPMGSARKDHVLAMRAIGTRRVPIVDDAGRARFLVSCDDEVLYLARRLGDLAGTMAPGNRHGPLRAGPDIFDGLEALVAQRASAEGSDAVDETHALSHDDLMRAIADLRKGLSEDA